MMTSTIDPVQKGHRFLELDSLRGVAAFAVVLTHFDGALVGARHPIFDGFTHLLGSGHSAVILFFLLSGFVLTVPYLGHSRPTYPAFLIKRVCRIYLPYAAATLLAALFASRLYSTEITGKSWIDQTWSVPVTSHLLAQHLLMIGHFDSAQLNTAIWSLVIEMRISLVFPLILWIAARLRSLVIATLFIPLTVVFASLSTRSGHHLFADTFFYSMFFVAGSLVRRHYSTIACRLTSLTGPSTFFLFLFSLAIYEFAEFLPFARFGASAALDDYLRDWSVALGAVLILLLATTYKSFRRLLHGSAVVWAGTRSYSIYLLHGTVLFAMLRLRHGLLLSPAIFVTYLLIVIVASEGFHRLIEVPALRLGRRLGGATVPNNLRPPLSEPAY